MKEDLHDIDKLFQSAINEHEEMPSGEVWNSIENNLDKKDVANYRKKNNGLKKLSVLLLLLLSGVTLYILNTPKNTKTTSVKVVEKSNNNISNANPSDQQKNNEKIKNSTSSEEAINIIEKTELVKDSETNSKEPITANRNKQKVTDGNIQLSNNSKRNIKNNSNAEKDIASKQKKEATLFKNGSFKKLSNTALSLNKYEDKRIVKNNRTKETKTTRRKISAKISGSEIDDYEDTEKQTNTAIVIDNNNDKTIIGTNIKDSSSIESNKATPLALVTATPKESGKTSSVKKKDQKKKQSAFSLNPFYSPDFAFYHLKNDSDHDDNNPGNHEDEDRDEIDHNEDHGNAFTAGVTLGYSINKHWSLESGITFSKTSISSNPKKIYAEIDNTGKVLFKYNASSGYAYMNAPNGNMPAVGDSIEALTSVHTIKYVGIPLAVKYNFLYKKFEFNIKAGIVGNILVDGEIEASLKDNNEEEYKDKCQIEGLKKVYFSGLAGIGAAYNLNKKWAITFSPTARFAISSINKNVAVKSYPNSFGLSTGLRFKF